MGTSLPPLNNAAAPSQQGQGDDESRWSQEQAITPPPQNTVRTTQYGWTGDDPSDYNTSVLKVGNRDNPLTDHAAALSDSEAQQLNAKPGDVLRVGGQLYYYADRAPEKDARVDLYQPSGMDTSLPDYAPVQNLGGGSDSLRGTALSQTGLQNIAAFNNNGAQPATSTVTQNSPVAPPSLAPMNTAAYLQLLKQLQGTSNG
jgi:hypothetical protein